MESTGHRGPGVYFLGAVLLTALAVPSFREPFDGTWRRRWRVRELADEASTYRIVIDDGDPALEVVSRESATMIWRPVIGADEGDAWITWRWSVLSSYLPEGRDTRRRAGDDYAARMLVVFGDDVEEPVSLDADPLGDDSRVLCYVWADAEAVGSIYPSPYFDRVVTVVLQSGASEDGGWVSERRDLAADYRTAFGEAPPPVAAVALMVDTDDTGSRATTRFDDVELRFSSP